MKMITFHNHTLYYCKAKKEEKYDIAIVILINNVLTNILIILLNILIL